MLPYAEDFIQFIHNYNLVGEVSQILENQRNGLLDEQKALSAIQELILNVEILETPETQSGLETVFKADQEADSTIEAAGKNYLTIHTPSQLPDPSHISQILEPWIKLEIITPEVYLGKIIELITAKRGNYTNISLLSGQQMQLTGELPLAEMIVDFYDDLKSSTKGYATMSYEIVGFRPGDLVKIDILVNHKVVDPLSFMTHRLNSEAKGRQVCEKLKELIPRQQIDIAIQAAIGARIIARETIKPFRKDVTAKLYGGDITRRMKLLDKQKEGKKRMKMVGNVEIPQSAFLNILKK